MNYDILHNFISPVTGRVPLIKDYILVGGNDNFSIPSPKLIDMQLDIIDIRHEFDNLAASSFIVGFPNTQLPNSQVLNSLVDGFMFNTAGIVSTTNNIPLPSLTYNNIWIGDINNLPVANPTILQSNLPNLTQNNIWIGDVNNRPVGVQLNFAPNDAAYILKTANANLNQAQALDILGIGMAKIVAGGAFAIAIPDEDYATVATLQELADQAAASAEEAAASATEAAASATEASASALEATGAALEATGAALEATGAAAAAGASATAAGLSATGAGVSALAAAASAISAGSSSSSASSSASDAASSATNAANSATNSASSATQAHDYLNTLLTTGITLQGDITGSGGLSSPITTTFIQNPVFHGNGSLTLPAGNVVQRPTILIAGMIRLNTL